MSRTRCVLLALTLGLLAGGPGWADVIPPAPEVQGHQNKRPSYPPESKSLGQEGRVMLRVLVGASGKVLAVNVVQSSGYPLLDQSALDAVQTWRFVPGTRDGVPDSMWTRLPVTFLMK
ncbi:energy transducer TonB [Delftia acidovorans]|uniref:energy transducer TonB n=1 Tax=Delftia acidovorans TaxID=80866 RepID=UPI0028E78A4F|nr:energy transducer TonB [Delftia acidovorans]